MSALYQTINALAMVPDLKTSYLPKTKYITERVVYRRENFAHRVIAPGRVFFRRLIKNSVANRAKHKIVFVNGKEREITIEVINIHALVLILISCRFSEIVSNTQERNII